MLWQASIGLAATLAIGTALFIATELNEVQREVGSSPSMAIGRPSA